ncbi:MAG: efflux RND transporter periplasmic adaptor subunit, partial [Sulfurihydrogenibium sp.]|nr:efflux RND transporter periplasmic adaptor subunit [Sulfurihydrogenibium sp.]
MISRVFLYMVVLTSFVLFSCNKESKSSDNEKNTKKQIQTVEVVYQEVPDYIEATGLVQPDKDGTVKITSKLPGIVQSINVQVGDYVKKGQVLASVKAPDTTDLYSQKVALSVQLSQ